MKKGWSKTSRAEGRRSGSNANNFCESVEKTSQTNNLLTAIKSRASGGAWRAGTDRESEGVRVERATIGQRESQ